jgi:hypothetical protein
VERRVAEGLDLSGSQGPEGPLVVTNKSAGQRQGPLGYSPSFKQFKSKCVAKMNYCKFKPVIRFISLFMLIQLFLQQTAWDLSLLRLVVIVVQATYQWTTASHRDHCNLTGQTVIE